MLSIRNVAYLAQLGGIPDPDALDFIERASITDATQKSAIFTLVTSLKTSGVWDKAKVIYPFVGGTATAHSQNLLSSSFAITWAGTVIHSATGVKSNGTNGFGRTGFISSANLASKDSGFVHVYMDTPVVNGRYAIGTQGVRASLMGISDPGLASVGGLFHATFHQSVVGNVGGNLLANRTAAASEFVYSDTATSAELTTASTALPTIEHYVLTSNNAGSPTAGTYMSFDLRFAAIGNGLSSAERLALMEACETYQTALSRSVFF